MPCAKPSKPALRSLGAGGSLGEAGVAHMHYVYLIESTSAPGIRYKGYTTDLRQRIADHNSGKNVSTKPHRPWRLQTYLAFSSKAQAIAFESYLKSGSRHALAQKRLWP